MPRSESPISPLNAIAAAIVVLASLLVPPGVYLLVAHSNLVASMESQAQLDAAAINVEIIGKAPQLWQFQEVRLNEMMSHRIPEEVLAKEYLRVLDSNEKVVAAVGNLPSWPVVARSLPLFDAGRVVGRLEIQRSLRPLLFNAALLSLFGIVLAAASFATLRVIPLRAVLGANAMLRQREASLAFANTVLNAATEGSLDAILIVNERARIISYNEHFIDMWQIPRELVEARADTPVLDSVKSRAKDPGAFLARVKYLYDHPEEASQDRLELTDGRIIDRHTRSLHDPDGHYLGRIWFFRDITERENAARVAHETLVRTQAQLQTVGQVGQAEALSAGDVETLARQVTELGARASGCERVNVWLFNETETELRCIDLYEATPARHSAGLVLQEDAFHNELEFIKSEKYVNADDALTDRRTTGYVETYLKPLRITSMLDTAIQVSGRTFGLLCFEHVDKPHHWERDEIAFAGQLADKIGLALISRMRREAEEALRQSETRFRAIFDNARDGIALMDIESKTFAMANDQLCRMLGYTRAEFATLRIADVHSPEVVASVIETFERHARGDTKVEMDIPIRRKNGAIFYVDVNSAPVAIGGKQYLLAIFRDATARKEAEEAIRKSEEKYRNLVEATTDYIWEIDQEGQYTYVSPAAKALLGYDPQELLGKTPFDLMPAAEAERVENIFAPIAAARQPFSLLENAALRKDGREIVLETSGVPIFDADGTFKGYRGIDRDVTQRKIAERALQQRDALLHAVAISSTELVTAPTLDDAIPKALETISKTVGLDRITVIERPAQPDFPPHLRYAWYAPDIKIALDPRYFDDRAYMTPQIAAWRAPLAEGKIVISHLRTATGDVKKRLELLGIKSLLVVPVSVDGKYWGQMGFDSCKQERRWPEAEIEILKSMADLIGSAIQRERYVKEIADANRIVQNTPTILYRLRGDPTMPMIYISQNISLFGHEPAVLTASPQLYRSLIHPDDIATVRDSLLQALDQDVQRGVFEFRLLDSRGNYRWVENRYTPIRDSAGRLVEIEGLLIDITERKAAEERIALLARTDPLTGLPNRSTFIERLRQSFAASRRGAAPFAVLYLDIDRFKDINDTLGHPLGDRLLITVGEQLKNSIREIDLVARLGGDEFAILQADLTDTSDAGTLAEKLRAALAEPVRIGGNELHITASIGISIYDSDTPAPEDLLAQADIALYRAKEEGRDQFRFHTEELDIQVREQVAVADELRTALKRNEFELVYQPQVEVNTGQIVGMEALIRWHHPTRGLLMPAAFIAVAERTGAITPIGQWALERACQQMHDWHKSGIAPLTIAVNISPVQIKTPNEFVEYVTTTLAKWDLSPGELELDVTESMLARATLAQNDVLERLRKVGVKISIDDFGTKYSSLDYLRTYRVNRLKIPRPLVDQATRDPDAAAMVRAIIGIARELNIEVIAQGVETQAQWSFLTAASPAAKVQGYYYSEPVPADRAGVLLQHKRIAPAADRRPARSPNATPS